MKARFFSVFLILVTCSFTAFGVTVNARDFKGTTLIAMSDISLKLGSRTFTSGNDFCRISLLKNDRKTPLYKDAVIRSGSRLNFISGSRTLTTPGYHSNEYMHYADLIFISENGNYVNLDCSNNDFRFMGENKRITQKYISEILENDFKLIVPKVPEDGPVEV